MFGIKIVCVGKLKEKYFEDACGEYRKRLSAYSRIDIEELPEQHLSAKPSQAEIDAALQKEAYSIALRIPHGAAVIALCIEGGELDSENFAKFLDGFGQSGKSRLCFIIGGSHGLDESIKKRADVLMSMSKMTFPHHLARVMLLEQIYRGFKINEGSRYHK